MVNREKPVEYTPADPVVAQYDRWLYPAPVDDLNDPSVAAYLKSFGRLAGLSPIYWPDRPPRQAMDVLVAGCGTLAGASYALLNPQCRVVGIDISRAALAHEQRLKEHHQLANLTLHHCPIEQAASLGASFDFIACQGVLHHMPDPAAGLRALGGVLRTDGVIALMLYGRYARTGVYMLQDMFRMIGLQQVPEDVAVVREALANLHPSHPVQSYVRFATDLGTDNGLVDTFLHPRDRSFAVSDCLALVKDAGLVFQGWDQNFFHYPEGPFQGAPALRQRLERLPDEQLWQAMELAVGLPGVQFFHVCRPDRDPASYRIPWDSPRLLDCAALLSARLVKTKDPAGQTAWAMAQPNLPPVSLTEPQAAIFSHANGRNTIRHCVTAAGIRGDDSVLLAAARDLLRRVWRCGFGVLRW